MAQAATSAIESHEKVCSQRWKSTMESMSDIKRIIAWGTGSLIASMATLIGFLATHPVAH